MHSRELSESEARSAAETTALTLARDAALADAASKHAMMIDELNLRHAETLAESELQLKNRHLADLRCNP